MTETVIPSAVLAAGAALIALAAAIYSRIRSYGRAQTQSGSADLEFSMARYQPLFRLLSGSDAGFLTGNRQCPGVTQRWGSAQRRVIRLYLRELAADFQSLHRRARVLAAESAGHAHLMPRLFQQQIAFWRALLWIEVRLTFGREGINPEALATAIEALHGDLLPQRTAQDQPA